MPGADRSFEDQFLEHLDGAVRQSKTTADRAMVLFTGFRITLVVVSASLPALTVIAPPGWSTGAAVLVAALAGLDTQFRWGEEWRHFRSTQLALERLRREYRHRQSVLSDGGRFGSITSAAQNFEKLFTDVESLLQTEADHFFKFRVTEWQAQKTAS
jgi:hypothetical protein